MAESAITTALRGMRIVDVDSHVTEPSDLWTSRVASTWGDLIPHVKTHPTTGVESWFIGDDRISDVGALSYAEWKLKPPYFPPTLADTTPGSWQPEARLEWMDRNNIHAQVIYPNILGFIPPAFLRLDATLKMACVRAYNDFQTEFAATAPDRILPIAYLPWWDLDECSRELARCVDLGHKGVILPWEFESQGLPPLRSEYWRPVLSAIEEAELPLSFHIGFGREANINKNWRGTSPEDPSLGRSPGVVEQSRETQRSAHDGLDPLEIIGSAAKTLLGNANCIQELIVGRVCHNYPTLRFVSVESGIGYVPYLLDGLDWHFKNTAASDVHADMLLPSEYFRRQIYATFWFETDIARLADLYPDNFMFQTDYPHPTSLAAGPNSTALGAEGTIAANCATMPVDLVQKLVERNACRLYSL
jgi:predicted TIM-barrel fold metal-dependent hydrolase